MNKILWFKLILDDIFELKTKPHIVRKGKITWPGNIDCWGMYEGEPTRNGKFRHRIEYYYKTNDETIFSTLAHEYVHAWQMEKGLELEHSEQKEFRDWEDYFLNHFDVKLQF